MVSNVRVCEESETLRCLLERITTKYNVRINLADVGGIRKIDSKIEDIFRQYSYHNKLPQQFFLQLRQKRRSAAQLMYKIQERPLQADHKTVFRQMLSGDLRAVLSGLVPGTADCPDLYWSVLN